MGCKIIMLMRLILIFIHDNKKPIMRSEFNRSVLQRWHQLLLVVIILVDDRGGWQKGSVSLFSFGEN
jgi:hypothetical protein